jgi:hypothetical protein
MKPNTLTAMGFEFTREHVRFFISTRFEEVRARHAELREKYSDSLTIQTRLRAAFTGLDAGLIRAGIAQCELAEQAVRKLAIAPPTLLTRKGLEQASASMVARVHASLFGGMRTVLDVCSGIGIDAIALGRAAKGIVCIESDEVTASMLRWNLSCNDVASALVLRGEASRTVQALALNRVDAVFADPDRRPGGRRTLDAEAYSPPLAFFTERFASLPLAVKVSPASDITGDAWHRMFVAKGGECSGQLLLRGIDSPAVSVVDAETGERWTPRVIESPDVRDASILIEAHSAIVRSGCVREYLAELHAAPIDPRIAYGVAAALPPASRWHASFHILERIPWNLRAVQQAVRRNGFGPGTEIKKRGFPLLPEQLRGMLRFEGEANGVLVCTRIGDEKVVYVCEREGG